MAANLCDRSRTATGSVRNRHKHALAAFGACLCISCLVALPQRLSGNVNQATNDTLEVLRSVASAGLRKLELEYEHLRGRGVYSMQNLRAGILRVHDVEFAIDGDNRKLIETVSKFTGKDASQWLGVTYVKVIGPTATFRLGRKPNTQSYETHFLGESNRETRESIRIPIDQNLNLLRSAFLLPSWMRLTDLLKHPGFQPLSISRTAIPDGSIVRVEFTVKPGQDVKTDEVFQRLGPGPMTGWFELLPDLSWAVHKHEFKFRDAEGFDATYNVQIKYKAGTASVPLVEKASRNMLVNGQPMYIESLELPVIANEPSPAEEFTPAAFGLTADIPAPPPQSRNLFWLWITIAVLLVVAVALRYATRRKVAL